MSDPIEVFPIGQFLAEEMDERGWTSGDVALRMSNDLDAYGRNQLIVELILSVQPDMDWILSDDISAGLSLAFGVSDGFFSRLHEDWRKWPKCRATFHCPDHLYGAPRTSFVPPGSLA